MSTNRSTVATPGQTRGEETGKGKAGELTGGAEGGHQSHDDATELHARGSLTTVGTGRQEERDRQDARIETTQTDTSPVTSRSFSATVSHSLSAFLTSATSLGASPTIPEVVLNLHVGIGVGRGVFVLNADSNVSHCALRYEMLDMYAFQVSGSLLI